MKSEGLGQAWVGLIINTREAVGGERCGEERRGEERRGGKERNGKGRTGETQTASLAFKGS